MAATQCDPSYGFLPCSSTAGGALFLVGAYGWLLLKGANLISDGGEALLDAGVAASLVGGLVLPIMGALPDTLIVLASGFHGAAARGSHPRRALREQVDVGVGALVGSTVMLLTVVYGGSILAGRCSVDPRTGRAVDRRPPALDESRLPRWLRSDNGDDNGDDETDENQQQDAQVDDVERGEGLGEALLPSSALITTNPKKRLARRLSSACRRAVRTLVAHPLLLLFSGAVSTDARTPAAARVMAASTALWLFAELPVLLARSWGGGSPAAAARVSAWASLAGTWACLAALAVYCLSHVLRPHSDEAEAAALAAERGPARHYYLAAHRHALRVRAVRSFAWAAGSRHGGLVDARGCVRPEATLALFRRFDRDGSGAIDRAELRALITGLEIARPGLSAGRPADAPPRILPSAAAAPLLLLRGSASAAAQQQAAAQEQQQAAALAKALGHPLLSDAELEAHARAWMREFDRDRSGGIDYGEFHSGIERWVAYKRRAYARRREQELAEKERALAPGAAAAEAVVLPTPTLPESGAGDAVVAAPASPVSSAGGRAAADEASGSGTGDADEQPQPQQQQDKKKKKSEAEKAARREAKRRALDPVGAETAALAALDGEDADPAGMAIPSLRRASSSGGAGGGGAAAAAAGSPAAAAALTAALVRRCAEEDGCDEEDGVALFFENEEEDDDEQDDAKQQQVLDLAPSSAASLSRGNSSGGGGEPDGPAAAAAAEAAAPPLPMPPSPPPPSSGPIVIPGSSSFSSSSSDTSASAAAPSSLYATLALSAAWFAAGTLLCAAFAGPLVNSLGDLATATRIPAFTLSFFLAPLAANASELVSSLRFAAGRRASRISATFSQVYGAVVMNHTMVLGALMAVAHAQRLSLLPYAGQALTMALPTLAVGWLGATRTTFRAWLGPALLAAYPLALGAQYYALK